MTSTTQSPPKKRNVVLGGPHGPIEFAYDAGVDRIVLPDEGVACEFYEQREGRRFFRHPRASLADMLELQRAYQPGAGSDTR